MNVNGDTGSVEGVRFETRGKGSDISFRAKNLWKGAQEGITVTVKLNDLSRVKWKNEGAERNQSYWLDAGELEVGYIKDGQRIEDEDLEAIRVGGLAVRLTMHPVGVDKMCLYGGIIPMSKSELRDMLGSDDPHMDSPYIPTMCLKLMWSKGKALNAFPLSFLPVEKETDKVGLGHPPFIELVGRGEPIFPKHDNI